MILLLNRSKLAAMDCYLEVQKNSPILKNVNYVKTQLLIWQSS